MKKGFTLAESATYRGKSNALSLCERAEFRLEQCESQKFGRGFTLAEVLITLAIIGVVAAMTIPTLIAKINSIVTDNQQKVFNAKIIKGLNLTKTAGDLNNTYNSTYDFLVNSLSKNLKMAKVCDKNNIRDCIPYDKIKYEDKSGNEKTVDVKDITTVNKLNLKAPYMDPAAFVLADGTPVIVSYNKECIDDPDKADTTINACLAGIYDLNGSRKPNKYSTKIVMKDGAAVKDANGKDVTTETGDLRGFNGAYIGSSCFGQIGDLCIASGAVVADDSMLGLIQAVDPSYTMPSFINHSEEDEEENDYWQLAYDYCAKVQKKHLPAASDLAKIAKVLYDNNSIAETGANYSLDWVANKLAVFSALGIDSTKKQFYLWSSEQPDGDNAPNRVYNPMSTFYQFDYRSNWDLHVICLE